MSSATNLPTVGSSLSPGDVSWTSPSNITADDFNSAQVYLSGGQTSEILGASHFGFAIPSGATIDGIVVRIERNGMGTVDDVSVQLTSGGSAVGDIYTAGSSWAMTPTVDSFGHATDDWNAGLSDTDVNDDTFGVQLVCTCPSGGMALVNYIEIEVYYTAGGGGASDVPQVVVARGRAAVVSPANVSRVFAPPIYVAAAPTPTVVPLVVFPGNVSAIARQSRARLGGLTISVLPADALASAAASLPTVIVVGSIAGRLPRTQPRSAVTTPIAADPAPSAPPAVIVLRSRSVESGRPRSVIAYWTGDGHGECHCEPGGVILVSGGLGVVQVESETSADVGAVVLVASDTGRAVLVSRCDC